MAIPFQIAHQAEHTYLLFNYVFEGTKVGGPGLLGTPGGLIKIADEGGLGLVRPDLHWIYNTLYTIPFVISLVYQLKRTYDESLDEAFPDAPLREARWLRVTCRRSTTTRASSSWRRASDDKRLYIITEGEAGVYEDQDGQEVEVGHLHTASTSANTGCWSPTRRTRRSSGRRPSCPSWPWTRRPSAISWRPPRSHSRRSWTSPSTGSRPTRRRPDPSPYLIWRTTYDRTSLAPAKTIEGNPLNDRIPDNTTPGIIFTSIVFGSMILLCVYVWYKHYGPGAAPDDAERY